MARMRKALEAGGIEDPKAETRILVTGLLDLTLTDIVTGADRPIPDEKARLLEEAIARRLSGEPPFRIIGRRSFYDLELTLNKATLEPRPDTETLVDAVLEHLRDRRAENLTILDLGTGTGAICLALLSALENATGTGSDLSTEALEAAAQNARLNDLEDRFSAVLSNWFDAIEGRFDVIVSNPPYIASDVVTTLDREVRDHDPQLALDGGADGLDAYRAIASQAADFLKPGGLVGLEIGYDQRESVTALFMAHNFALLEARADLGGRDRVLLFAH